MILIYCLLVATVAYGSHIPELKSELDPKIVGGAVTTIDKLPYQVSLQYITSHICGASIISKDVVLTAAHCTYGKTINTLSIKAGETDMKKPGSRFFIKKIIQHENFSMTTVDNDISILKLTTSIKFNAFMQPVPLQENGEEIPAGTNAIISGWGALEEGGHSVNILHYAVTKFISYQDCVNQYANFHDVTTNMICAEAAGIDSCQGDSGGPVVSNDKLVGIVSWGRGCARPFSPGVYTKVSALRPWIDENLQNL